MSWLSELAGKAENLLNNLDEQTGAALRNHNVTKKKNEYGLHKDPPWAQPQKKKLVNKSKKSQYTENKTSPPPSRKTSPLCHQSQSGYIENNEVTVTRRRSPSRNPSQMRYNLEHCPKTLVGDIKNVDCEDKFKLNVIKKHRRNSFPVDSDTIDSNNMAHTIQKMQDLDVENVMLKNELNVMVREVTELITKLHQVEDDLTKTTEKLEICERLNHTVNLDKASLSSQLDQLKQNINYLTKYEIQRIKDANTDLENKVSELKLANSDLNDRIHTLENKVKEKDNTIKKLESEQRHTQTRINELESELEKSQNENKQLEKDWETYKVRVKSMLQIKDNEIKELKQGLTRTEESQLLAKQVENLKDERQELSLTITGMREDYEELKQTLSQLETRHESAERVVTALRDALKGEWSSRNRAEAQCATLSKELKTIQTEAGQTIASLRLALRDKENELNRLRETTSYSVRTTDTSALNVADYDLQDSIDNEKIQYLTQLLVQKQEKIDSLLADNNTMRIHFDKLESKYRAEMAALRGKTSHSVVQLADGDRDTRLRRNALSGSALTAASYRIGVFIKRNPVFRLFVIFYMFCLHFWVMTVLLTKAPDNHLPQYRM